MGLGPPYERRVALLSSKPCTFHVHVVGAPTSQVHLQVGRCHPDLRVTSLDVAHGLPRELHTAGRICDSLYSPDNQNLMGVTPVLADISLPHPFIGNAGKVQRAEALQRETGLLVAARHTGVVASLSSSTTSAPQFPFPERDLYYHQHCRRVCFPIEAVSEQDLERSHARPGVAKVVKVLFPFFFEAGQQITLGLWGGEVHRYCDGGERRRAPRPPGGSHQLRR
jgi:hypothetical protein